MNGGREVSLFNDESGDGNVTSQASSSRNKSSVDFPSNFEYEIDSEESDGEVPPNVTPIRCMSVARAAGSRDSTPASVAPAVGSRDSTPLVDVAISSPLSTFAVSAGSTPEAQGVNASANGSASRPPNTVASIAAEDFLWDSAESFEGKTCLEIYDAMMIAKLPDAIQKKLGRNRLGTALNKIIEKFCECPAYSNHMKLAHKQLGKRSNKAFKTAQREIWATLRTPAEKNLCVLIREEWRLIEEELRPIERSDNDNMLVRIAHFVVVPDTRTILESIHAGDGANEGKERLALDMKARRELWRNLLTKFNDTTWGPDNRCVTNNFPDNILVNHLHPEEVTPLQTVDQLRDKWNELKGKYTVLHRNYHASGNNEEGADHMVGDSIFLKNFANNSSAMLYVHMLWNRELPSFCTRIVPVDHMIDTSNVALSHKKVADSSAQKKSNSVSLTDVVTIIKGVFKESDSPSVELHHEKEAAANAISSQMSLLDKQINHLETRVEKATDPTQKAQFEAALSRKIAELDALSMK